MSSTNNGGTQYTINFVNNSPNTGSMVVFQQPVSMEMDGVMSLAWFAKKVHPTTSLSFEWNTTLNFVWSETGKLDHGIHFSDSQTPEADIMGNNSIQLTYDGAFNFINQTAANIPGSLYIKQDETIPVNKASVGIGMSGAGTFVVQAQPNMEAVFTRIRNIGWLLVNMKKVKC